MLKAADEVFVQPGGSSGPDPFTASVAKATTGALSAEVTGSRTADVEPDDAPSDKTPRFESVTDGTTPAGLPPLDVVAVLGDNILDFPGMDQSLRREGASAFADFGTRYFVLPNPMYGSWERN